MLWYCLFRPRRGAGNCDEQCLSLHRVRASHEPNVRTSPNFPCLLPVAVARSNPACVVIWYVFPVLWMTSCFHVFGVDGVTLPQQFHRRVRPETPTTAGANTRRVRGAGAPGRSMRCTIALYVTCVSAGDWLHAATYLYCQVRVSRQRLWRHCHQSAIRWPVRAHAQVPWSPVLVRDR